MLEHGIPKFIKFPTQPRPLSLLIYIGAEHANFTSPNGGLQVDFHDTLLGKILDGR